jgi:small GTP-binding protein
MTERVESISEDYYDEKIKLMIIGETRTGKTSLISRYCKGDFAESPYLSTIGIDFQIKNLTINSKKIRLQIWDTAGQERFRNIAKNYYQSSDGFIIVYDITNSESFQTLDYWVEEIKSNSHEFTKMILVGNKCDLEEERQVKKEEGKDYAKKEKIKFYEVSAKEGTNINTAFDTLVKDILSTYSPSELMKKRGSKMLSIPVLQQQKKSSCC